MYDKTPLQTLDFHRSMLVDEDRCRGYMRAIFKAARRCAGLVDAQGLGSGESMA